MAQTVVVAIGGNALTLPWQPGTHEQLRTNARAMAACVRELREAGNSVVLVHGNGPQIGNLAFQQEQAAPAVPALPFFLLDAMTQGEIGSLLGLALRNELGAGEEPVAIVTHVLVDPDDTAFANPTKPIGPFLSEEQAERLAAERGWTVVEDAGRGMRRAVPSPRPRGILELDAVRSLVDDGSIVIACGGGGVPVARIHGELCGVDAVIDKDFAAERLASDLGADVLAMVTGVSHVAVDFGTPSARDIDEMSVAQARAFFDAGQFPAGSMGPKVSAGLGFVASGGSLAVITSPPHILGAVSGRHGTRIVPTGAVAVA